MIVLLAQTVNRGQEQTQSAWQSIVAFLFMPDLWVIIFLALGVWLLMVGLFYFFDALNRGRDAIIAAHMAIFFGWFLGGGGAIAWYYYVWWRNQVNEYGERIRPDWEAGTLWFVFGIFGLFAVVFLITVLSAYTKRNRPVPAPQRP